MSKKPNTVGDLLDAMPESRTYNPYSRWSFYRPHNRVKFMNEVVHPITGEITNPSSRTRQEFKAECDINNIIKAFKVSGQLTHISAKAAMGAYLDLPEPTDYQESLNIIREAQESFATLPSKVRDRFGNDPEAFLAFMNDPANKDEAIELGLVQKPAVPKPEAGGSSPPPPPPPSPPPAAPPPAAEPPKA